MTALVAGRCEVVMKGKRMEDFERNKSIDSLKIDVIEIKRSCWRIEKCVLTE